MSLWHQLERLVIEVKGFGFVAEVIVTIADVVECDGLAAKVL